MACLETSMFKEFQYQSRRCMQDSIKTDKSKEIQIVAAGIRSALLVPLKNVTKLHTIG